MTDRDTRPGHGGSSPEGFDRDVNVRAIVWFAVILAAITLVAGLAGTFIIQSLATSQERRDPEPLPVREAGEPVLPPGPRLQATPEEDLAAMLAEEEARLERYSLLEEGGEYARIPIGRAMELILEQDLGAGGAGEAAPDQAPTPEEGMPPAAGPVGAGAPLADAAPPGSRSGRSENPQATEGQHAQ